MRDLIRINTNRCTLYSFRSRRKVNMSVLVAYATSCGSTREIAERIAAGLAPRVAPASVDCTPASEVPRLSSVPNQYRAVVIGSALHAGRWIGPGRSFVRTNAAYLSGSDRNAPATPVWAFTVGMPPTDEDMENEEKMVREKLQRSLGADALRGHQVFRGVFEMKDLNWFFRTLISCCVPEDKKKFGDHRDWDAIDAWADGVGKAMRETGVGVEARVNGEGV